MYIGNDTAHYRATSRFLFNDNFVVFFWARNACLHFCEYFSLATLFSNWNKIFVFIADNDVILSLADFKQYFIYVTIKMYKLAPNIFVAYILSYFMMVDLKEN